MEWTKIKAQHFVSPHLTMANKGCLATIIAYTSMIEREPTKREIYKVCGKNCARSLEERMKFLDESIEEVTKKVLEDVSKVKKAKNVSIESSARYRNTQGKSDGHAPTSRDATDKTRLDKRREDIKQQSRCDVLKKQVYEKGFNIHSLINRVNKERNSSEPFPDSVIETICERFLKDPAKVKNQWAWFVSTLKFELDKYFAGKQQEQKPNPRGGFASTIGDILKGSIV